MINITKVAKYNTAYANITPLQNAVTFSPDSPYYYEEVFVWIMPMYVPDVLEWTYEISNYGRVYTHLKSPYYPNGGFMSPSVNGKGYRQINLKGHHTNKICCKISRLVMLHFNYVPGCQYLEVDHINRDKDNNSIWNLEWVTVEENNRRARVANHRTDINEYIDERYRYKCYDSYDLLSNTEAAELYRRTLDQNANFSELADEYDVSINYVKGLNEGLIRSYIAENYNKNYPNKQLNM